jgi:hypothetical protein
LVCPVPVCPFGLVLVAFSPPTLSAKNAERMGHPVLCVI